MKKYFTGIILGFSLCLALVWAVTIDDQPLVKTAAGQTVPPISELLQNVDPALLQNIDPSLLQNLDPSLLQNLDPALLQGLDPSLLQNLDPSLLQNLDPSLLENLDPAAIGELLAASGISLTDLLGANFLDSPIPDTLPAPTISRDVLEYWRLFLTKGRGISTSVFDQIGPQLLVAPPETDTEWILATGDLLSAFTRATRQEIVGITPPESVVLAHERMIGALNDCSLSTQYFDQGLERLLPDDIRIALELMNSCAHQLAAATDMMLAIEPTAPISITGGISITDGISATTMISSTIDASSETVAASTEATAESESEEEVEIIAIEGTPQTLAPLPEGCGCAENLYSCTDFDSQVEAQACYNRCLKVANIDIHRLDTDRNGLVCDEGS